MNLNYLGSKALREISSELSNEEISSTLPILENMFSLMHNNNGIGLAAPQVGINKRFFIMSIDSEQFVFFNPKIISHSEEKSTFEEGCLSLPTVSANVDRPSIITLSWINSNLEEEVREFSGIHSTCIQHEIDHLDGILFIDRISKLRKNMLTKKVMKVLS